LKIAITGATGFIGNNLTYYLHERGYDVTALVRSREKAIPFIEAGIAFKLCDITDRDSLKEGFNDVQLIVHLAALFNHPGASWDEYYRVNVEGTKNVVEIAMQSGVKRVIHCSTGGVVTGGGNPPYSEQTPYAIPAWDKYEKTKLEGEKVVLDFHREQDFDVVVIRPTQPYGPGDASKAKFYRMVKKGIIANPGNTKKHLIYIDDLCRAFEIVLTNESAKGEIFLIGSKTSIELKKLVGIVADNLGVPAPKLILPAAPIQWLCSITEIVCNFIRIKPFLYRRSMDFFTKSVEFDVTKAFKVLGYESQIDVSEGVSKTAAWYQNMGMV
jgi:nucleoside-diphosphate-sugar epimerase